MSSPHLWNGVALFGFPTRTAAESAPYRLQEEKLPGVSGARVYQLGRDPLTWKVHGRLTGATVAACKIALIAGMAAANGTIGTFTDSDGKAYTNCILKDFQQAGEIEGVDAAGVGATMQIVAVVQWLSPGGSLA